MSNIRKSFNFRNGLQVDDTKFIINANGLVGIGSTIPTQSLDVGENVKVHGTIETEYLTVNNTTTIPTTNSNRINVGVTSITSGIITATSSSGIITYYGDGGNLINLPTSQWVDVDPGFGYTSIYSAGFVGVGTVDPRFVFQVAGNTDTSVEGFTGVGIQTGGHILAAGIVTAYSFSGFGTNITGINASNISNGTLNNSRLAETIESSQLNLTGIATAYSFSGFGTDITGINASNISNGTVSNSRLPSDIEVSNINLTGIATAYSFSGFGTNITGINASNISNGTVSNSRLPSDIEVSNINLTGIITAYSFSGFGTDITGINASNISNGTLSNSRLASTVTVDNVVSTFTGDLTGTATTASSLSGTPNIEVDTVTASNLSVSGIVTASEFNVGTGGTIVNITSDGRVAIGSDTPTRPFEIITTGTSEIELVGSEARIILAQEKSGVGIADSAGVIRYGNSDDAFEFLNYTPGNFDFHLHAGGPGINTGRFNWIYGQDFNELLSLTYNGLLGVGVTDPEHNLHVVGTSTVTGNSFIGGDLTVSGDLNVTGTTNVTVTLPSVFDGNVNSTSGVSTFSNVIVSAGSSLGIGTDTPITDIDAFNRILVVGAIGVGQSIANINNKLPDIGSIYTDGQIICDGVGIGTTSLGSQSRTLMVYGNVELYPGIEQQGGPPAQISYVKGTKVEVAFDNESRIGIGTTVSQASVDFRLAGKGISGGAASFMMPPQVSTTVGLNTAGKEGALVFNTTTKKFQGYTGSAWVDLH
jgi:hypothetical protein